jgi:Domain of unknown function (DUF1833)
MSRTLSTAALEAIYSQETNQVFLVLLTIDHVDLTLPIRVVNNHQAITSNSQTYVPYAFEFDPPDEREGVITSAKLIIDNIDRSIVSIIRSLLTAPTVSVSIVLADSPDTIEAGPLEFQLKNVSYNVETVSGDLIYNDIETINIPGDTFNPADFGGLF